MKKLPAFAVFLLFFAVNSLAQRDKKLPNLITDQRKVYDVETEFYEMGYLDTLSCALFTCVEPGVVITLPVLDPEASNEEKQATIALMEDYLKTLSGYANCFNGKKLYLKLIDGLLLTQEEVKLYYAEDDGYITMRATNLKRFRQQYGQLCQEYFPNTVVYIENYDW